MFVTFMIGHYVGSSNKKDSKQLKQDKKSEPLKLPFQKEEDPTKKIWLDWQNEFKSMRKRHTLLLVQDYVYGSDDSYWSLCLHKDGELTCNHDYSKTYLASLSRSNWRKPWELTEEEQIRVAKLYPKLKQKVKEYYEKTPTKEDLMTEMLNSYEKAAEIYIEQ